MKHLLAFDTELQYQQAVDAGLDLPNVSYVRGSSKVHYTPDDTNYIRADVHFLDDDTKYIK